MKLPRSRFQLEEDPNLKRCGECLEILPISEYRRVTTGTAKLSRMCQTCYKEHQANRPPEQKAKAERTARRHHLKKTFNLTLERYEEMMLAQNSACAICDKPEVPTANGVLWMLAVDHDHSCCAGSTSCGECVRGLLCRTCNAGLANANDRIETLENLIGYLNG